MFLGDCPSVLELVLVIQYSLRFGDDIRMLFILYGLLVQKLCQGHCSVGDCRLFPVLMYFLINYLSTIHILDCSSSRADPSYV